MPSRPAVRPSTGLALLAAGTAVLMLGLAAPAAAAPAAPAATSTGAVAGSVLDGTNPVGAGVVVTARTPQGKVLASTTTDGTGAYTLSAVPRGDRVVCFDGSSLTTTWAAGYLFVCSGGAASAASASPVHVAAGATTTLDATVRPATVVTGHVTDPGGAALSQVVAGIGYDGGGPSASTSSDGSFRIVVDPSREPWISVCFDGAHARGGVSTAGYLWACWTDANGNSQVPAQPGQVLTTDQVLQPASAVTGRVTDPNGAGIGGVTVVAETMSAVGQVRTTTAGDGRYRIAGLPAGAQVSLSFVTDPTTTTGPSPEGYVSQCWRGVAYRYYFCAGGTTAIHPPTGGTTSGISPHLALAGGVSGRVVDAAGDPIPSLPLRVSSLSGFGGTSSGATTGPDGTYHVVGLTPGRYQVCYTADNSLIPPSSWADQDGYDPRCWRTGTTSGDPVTVTAGATASGTDLALVGRGALSGRVVDPAGAPIPSVGVTVSGAPSGSASFSTDNAGFFRDGHLSPGTYQVCYSAGPASPPAAQAPLGWVSQCLQAAVLDNTTTTTSPVTLAPAGAAGGKVTDAYGFAVQGVRVTVTGTADGATPRTISTAGDGTWNTGGLASGTYTVCFDPTDASRTVDGHVPRYGWAPQCWKKQVPTGTPTPVSVAATKTTGGVDAILSARPKPAA